MNKPTGHLEYLVDLDEGVEPATKPNVLIQILVAIGRAWTIKVNSPDTETVEQYYDRQW